MANRRNRLGALHACEPGLTIDDVRIAPASASVTTLPLPTAGTWSGTPGNSAFRLSDDTIVAYRDNGGKTIRGADLNALMEREHGTASVAYRNREPDFSPFEDPMIGQVDLERFSAESRRQNFRRAEKQRAGELGCSEGAIRERMRERGLVWHEHSNGKTLSAVPAPIHAAFVHGGGISVERSNAVIEEHLAQRFPNGFKLARQSETLHVEAHELERALVNLKRHYQEEKRARYPRRKERSMQENQDDSLAKDPEHVMDTQAMAELFGKSQGTVQKWCREGTIANAVKKEGRWLVEGLPVKRYRVTGRKRYNARKRYMDILKACNSGELATPQDLVCTESDFLDYVNLLIEKNLLRQKQGANAEHECDTLGYLVTLEGADLLGKGRTAQEALARIIESVAAGTTRGALSQ